MECNNGVVARGKNHRWFSGVHHKFCTPKEYDIKAKALSCGFCGGGGTRTHES